MVFGAETEDGGSVEGSWSLEEGNAWSLQLEDDGSCTPPARHQYTFDPCKRQTRHPSTTRIPFVPQHRNPESVTETLSVEIQVPSRTPRGCELGDMTYTNIGPTMIDSPIALPRSTEADGHGSFLRLSLHSLIVSSCREPLTANLRKHEYRPPGKGLLHRQITATMGNSR